jgi:hypothetical protein
MSGTITIGGSEDCAHSSQVKMTEAQPPREGSVPEHQRRGIPEHDQYEELCALAAGGLLEGREFVDFQVHMKECDKCRADYEELSSLVTHELPQVPGRFRQQLETMRAKPLPYSRQRFLRRARAEGVVFSREVETGAPSGRRYFRPAMLASVAVLVVAAVGLTAYHFSTAPDAARAKDAAAAQQIAELKRENAALSASVSRLNESIAAGQHENRDLRLQLGTATATAETLRRNGEQTRGEVARSSSQNAQLLEESQNQEKLLAEARDEAARSSQLRVNDESSLVEQQFRITELTNKLRVASATLDMERRLTAEGKNIRELMAARQLHVIDVRDTDPNGNPSQAFGRVFLTEGKTLTFYAFDLNQGRGANAKRSFQVWAVPQTGGNTARSLGFLRVDANSQGRWVLRVENPELVNEISSVFVTVEPAAGGQQPSGQKMLYAYLGEANHP